MGERKRECSGSEQDVNKRACTRLRERDWKYERKDEKKGGGQRSLKEIIGRSGRATGG